MTAKNNHRLISQLVALLTINTATFDEIRFKMRVLACLGILSHPVYYFIWTEVFPEKFDSFFVRLLYLTLAISWIVWDFYEKENLLLFRVFTYLLIIFALPFFFLFMYLMNDASPIWLGSLICGIFYLSLIVDAIKMFTMTIIGFVLAIAAIVLSGLPIDIPENLISHIPVVLFALLGGLVFKYLESFVIQKNQDNAMALAGSIAHELRTPIMGMQLELEALSAPGTHDELSQEDRHALDLLQQHHRKSSHIVNSLLQNVQRGEIDPTGFRPIAIGPIITQVIAQYPFFPNQRQLVHWGDTADFTFHGDAFLMSHVLMNLINNALKSIAAAEKGEIHVRLQTDGAHNILSFCDTGLGLHPKERDRIFDRFYSTTPGGAGLGLTFCQRAMRSFGGRIGVESEAGRYTDFRLAFPKVPPDHEMA